MYVRHNKNEVNKLNAVSLMIFRNGRYISKKEKWFYNGQNITVVNSGAFSYNHKDVLNEMANKARKGVTDIFRTLRRLGDFSAPVFFKMFDVQIKPMLLYGSEIWGLESF